MGMHYGVTLTVYCEVDTSKVDRFELLASLGCEDLGLCLAHGEIRNDELRLVANDIGDSLPHWDCSGHDLVQQITDLPPVSQQTEMAEVYYGDKLEAAGFDRTAFSWRFGLIGYVA